MQKIKNFSDQDILYIKYLMLIEKEKNNSKIKDISRLKENTILVLISIFVFILCNYLYTKINALFYFEDVNTYNVFLSSLNIFIPLSITVVLIGIYILKK